MPSRFALRLFALMIVLGLMVAFAPTAMAQGPVPSGTYTVTYYNYVSDEGGAACPSFPAVAGGSEGALNTFHFWPEYSSPWGGVNNNNYTVCWDGWITFPQAGVWNVQTINDDGMDIWVDGNITMQAWYDQGPTVHQGSTTINAIGAHHVIIKYYNRTLGGTACVGWGLNGQPIGYWNCPNNVNYYQPYAPGNCPTGYLWINNQCMIPTGQTGYQPYTQNGQYPYGQYPFGQYPYGQIPYTGQQYYGLPTPTPVPYYPPQQQQQYPYPYNGPQQHEVGKYCTYVIQRGDTLAGIAARYGLNYYVIAQYNGLTNPSAIYAGMVLHIPNCN